LSGKVPLEQTALEQQNRIGANHVGARNILTNTNGAATVAPTIKQSED